MPETNTSPFFESDYACVEPSTRANWYEVRVYRPDREDGFVVHETRNLGEANIFAGRLATIVRKWHGEAPPGNDTTATERVRQVLVTLPDRSQVGIFLGGGDADVHLRTSPGAAWDAPLGRATGDPHTTGTYHIGAW